MSCPGRRVKAARRPSGIGFDHRGRGAFKGRVNSLSAVTWVWKALRNRSVTFAALFALTLTGFSVISWLKWVLALAGAHWLALLVGPTLVVGILVRKEPEWIPDEQVRRRWARGLVFGSILAALLSGLLMPDAPAPARPSDGPPSTRPHGPRSK